MKCNETTGYFFSCTKVEQKDTEFTKRKGYMCLRCVQGQEVIYGWKSNDIK